MKDFKGKVAVVTGAASGIGRALAERSAEEGMKVVLAGINEKTLRLTEKGLKDKGASTLVVQTDVSKHGDVEALAHKTLETFGAAHLLFNNAGVGAGNTVWGSSFADWQWTLGVNLWGVIYGVHYFVPLMLKQNAECHIVNTSSVAGLFVPPHPSPYLVSKHAVVALSEDLYRQMQKESAKIGVSVLCPVGTKTNILSFERNRPADLKNSVAEEQLNKLDEARMPGLRQMIENGMAPSEVANLTFTAIKENKFYIIPNAERVKPWIQARMEDILQGRNPTSLAPPQK